MIIPAGNRKEQVCQGPTKHFSIFDTMMKEALLPGKELGNRSIPAEELNRPSPDLQGVMNDSRSNMNADRDAIPGVDSGQQTPAADPAMTDQDPAMADQGPAAGGWQQSIEKVYGGRVARILSNFLGELAEAEMMSRSFIPDPKKTKFEISGEGLKLIVPNFEQQPVQQKVMTPGSPALGEPMSGGAGSTSGSGGGFGGEPGGGGGGMELN